MLPPEASEPAAPLARRFLRQAFAGPGDLLHADVPIIVSLHLPYRRNDVDLASRRGTGGDRCRG